MESAADFAYSDEVDVEMAPAEDPYPEEEVSLARDHVEGDFSDVDDIEMPRGAAGQLLMGEASALADHNDHVLIDTAIYKQRSIEEETVKKTRVFIDAIKSDGVWARTLDCVKISVQNNAFLTKETIREFIHHLLTKVNNRPRSIIITSKTVTLDDISDMIRVAFTPVEDAEVALGGSLVRIYSKNTSPSLKKLAKCIADTCATLRGVEVEYHDIFAELLLKGRNRRRMRTSDLKSYFRYEDHARSLGFRVLASFTLSQRASPGREVLIRWYDELAKDGKTRVTYIHFDHSVRRQSKPVVSFSNEPPVVYDFDVDDDAKMVPTRLASSEQVTDFIEFLAKTAVGSHSL